MTTPKIPRRLILHREIKKTADLAIKDIEKWNKQIHDFIWGHNNQWSDEPLNKNKHG